MVYTELAERVRHLKESEEGEMNMCRLVEEYGNERSLETREENAKRLLENGKLTVEEIAECSGLPLEAVKKLAASK